MAVWSLKQGQRLSSKVAKSNLEIPSSETVYHFLSVLRADIAIFNKSNIDLWDSSPFPFTLDKCLTEQNQRKVITREGFQPQYSSLPWKSKPPKH